jgi:hypothetical protein
MKTARKPDWQRLKTLALSLGLPGVEETISWGQPTLKAHGKLWVWWSPHEDAPVFKVPFEEREILVEVEPDTFFFTPHYKSHPLVLVRPEKLGARQSDQGLARASAKARAEGVRRGETEEPRPEGPLQREIDQTETVTCAAPTMVKTAPAPAAASATSAAPATSRAR